MQGGFRGRPCGSGGDFNYYNQGDEFDRQSGSDESPQKKELESTWRIYSFSPHKKELESTWRINSFRSIEENVGKGRELDKRPNFNPEIRKAMPMQSNGSMNNYNPPQVHAQLDMLNRSIICDNNSVLGYSYPGNRNFEGNPFSPMIAPVSNVCSTVKQAVPVHGPRYKTEICKSYDISKSCSYGRKCLYAHGEQELRPIARHPKYKTELCRTFHSTGLCDYGPRCHFIHDLFKTNQDALNEVISSQMNRLVLSQIKWQNDLGSDGEASPSSSGCCSPTEFNKFFVALQ